MKNTPNYASQIVEMNSLKLAEEVLNAFEIGQQLDEMAYLEGSNLGRRSNYKELRSKVIGVYECFPDIQTIYCNYFGAGCAFFLLFNWGNSRN